MGTRLSLIYLGDPPPQQLPNNEADAHPYKSQRSCLCYKC